jgi:hypothetical protein
MWMLEHLTPEKRDEALAGDLLEQFRAGRSAGWYRRQVIGAIAMEWARGLWRRQAAILYAAIWSLLSPAWELFFANYTRHRPLIPWIWRLPFPLSTLSDLALRVALDLSFIWIGVTVYVVLCRIAFGKLQLRRGWVALLASLLAFAIASLGAVAVVGAMFAMGHFQGRTFDRETFTLLGVVKNFGIWSLCVRFQYFAGAAVALWFLGPKAGPARRLAA